MSITKIKKELQKYASKERANILQRFFKTGHGEYGEGDVFLGIKVPEIRIISKQYKDLPISQIKILLKSKFHEERLLALLILVIQYKKENDRSKKNICELYLKNTKYINNWDLIDLTAHHIVGDFLDNKLKTPLFKLANSKSLWERRISILSSFYYIKNNHFNTSLEISAILLNDKEDLIHKAVGWMLREIGKRNQKIEEAFLKKHYKIMPRTMLRYAIEKFPERKRKSYLLGKI